MNAGPFAQGIQGPIFCEPRREDKFADLDLAQRWLVGCLPGHILDLPSDQPRFLVQRQKGRAVGAQLEPRRRLGRIARQPFPGVCAVRGAEKPRRLIRYARIPD